MDLETFVGELQAWHASKVANLQNIIQGVKEGTRLEAGDVFVVFTDQDASFFKAGLETALMELGKLPFSVTRTVDDEE